MTDAKQIVLVGYDGAQMLDICGPADVFGTANAMTGTLAYDIRIGSSAGGTIRTSCGVGIASESLCALEPPGIDTALVVGGPAEAIRAAASDRALTDWLAQLPGSARRYGSVCSGIFILAGLGIAGGKRVATHWSATGELQRRFTDLKVDQDALFVSDGPLWTSSGVTTGIDMALAMVEQDLGVTVAHQTARQLVLYMRRPGSQSQFSPMLEAQHKNGDPFSDLIAWMRGNLDQDLSVPILAERVAMSERSFYRRFTASLGTPPAAFIQKLRIEAARILLSGDGSLKAIARQTGFGTAVQLTAAFDRHFGLPPGLYRKLHG